MFHVPELTQSKISSPDLQWEVAGWGGVAVWLACLLPLGDIAAQGAHWLTKLHEGSCHFTGGNWLRSCLFRMEIILFSPFHPALDDF